MYTVTAYKGGRKAISKLYRRIDYARKYAEKLQAGGYSNITIISDDSKTCIFY